MSIYCVHATNSVGGVVVKACRPTIDEALTDAGFALSNGFARVWIVDERGNLILPTDQVKARLNSSARAPRDFAN
jgi:hypothetical protein